MQDALTALPLVAAAVTRAPLGHLCAAVAHIVGSHDGAWVQRAKTVDISSATLKTLNLIFPVGSSFFFFFHFQHTPV